MMLYPTGEKPTKDRILEAAFSFFSGPRFTALSLGEIAAKAGITKAAIFRHFENKEALLNAMQQFLYDTIADSLRKAQDTTGSSTSFASLENCEVILQYTLRLIAEHPEYIWYLAYEFTYIKNAETVFYKEMEKRGIRILGSKNGVSLSEDGNHIKITNPVRYFAQQYVFHTIAFFIGMATKKDPSLFAPENVNKFADDISALIENGLNRKEDYITSERMEQIDRLCIINPSSMPPVDPLFTAFSNVIRDKGFPGITVEAIAGELGLAKSSLYTYFKNKDEMIIRLVQNELVLLSQTIIKHSSQVKTGPETGYAVMRIEMEFFSRRTAVIPVIAWLEMRGSFMPDEKCCKDFGVDILELNKQDIYSNEYRMTYGMYYNWISMVAASVCIHSKTHSLSEDQMYKALKECFIYIQQGLKSGIASADSRE